MPEEEKKNFENCSQKQNIFSEVWDFLKHNKKLWMLPIIVVLLLIALLIFLGGTSGAPFIYALF